MPLLDCDQFIINSPQSALSHPLCLLILISSVNFPERQWYCKSLCAWQINKFSLRLSDLELNSSPREERISKTMNVKWKQKVVWYNTCMKKTNCVVFPQNVLSLTFEKTSTSLIGELLLWNNNRHCMSFSLYQESFKQSPGQEGSLMSSHVLPLGCAPPPWKCPQDLRISSEHVVRCEGALNLHCTSLLLWLASITYLRPNWTLSHYAKCNGLDVSKRWLNGDKAESLLPARDSVGICRASPRVLISRGAGAGSLLLPSEHSVCLFLAVFQKILHFGVNPSLVIFWTESSYPPILWHSAI